MIGLIERARRIARLRAVLASRRIAEAAREALPDDIVVESDGERVTLSGRRIGARAIDDPRLRSLAALAREAGR